MTNLVSIVIPCYNGSRYLRESIDSALNQSYCDKEVVVVDDGSTDDSPAIMASYGDRIKVIQQQNSGLPAARNAGIHVASGNLFAFLDADDWWAPDFLHKMVSAIEYSHAGIAYCGWQNVGLPGPRGEPFIPPDYEAPEKLALFFAGPRWPVHAALVRRVVVESTGGFNPKWKSCEDFAFWIDTATRYTLVRVPEVLAFYRFHGNQMTTNSVRMAFSHMQVQLEYLKKNPLAAHKLGRPKFRELMYGRLLRKGFESYWARDLAAARTIFRKVMRVGYGNSKDWLYMLPALLPAFIHEYLVKLSDKRNLRPSK